MRFGEHILQTSATMAGVCITALGIVRLMVPGTVAAYVDKLLAVDCLLFVICSALSFAAIRVEQKTETLENIAESMFLVGLIILSMASLIIAFA